MTVSYKYQVKEKVSANQADLVTHEILKSSYVKVQFIPIWFYETSNASKFFYLQHILFFNTNTIVCCSKDTHHQHACDISS